MAPVIPIKDAGKIMIRPRGTYDDSARYEILDMVVFNGGSYVAKVDDFSGISPNSESHWQLMTQTIIDSTFDTASTNAISNKEVAFALTSIRDSLKELGIKNLIDIGAAASGTINGVTYRKENGIVTLSGTSASANTVVIASGSQIILKPGKYHFSGCPDGGGTNRYYLRLYTNTGTPMSYYDFGEGFDFILEETTSLNLIFGFASSISFSNLQFKPMVTYYFDDENTYYDFVPYQKKSGVEIDTVVNSTSTNPVQNKAIYSYIDAMITQAINGTY